MSAGLVGFVADELVHGARFWPCDSQPITLTPCARRPENRRGTRRLSATGRCRSRPSFGGEGKAEYRSNAPARITDARSSAAALLDADPLEMCDDAPHRRTARGRGRRADMARCRDRAQCVDGSCIRSRSRAGLADAGRFQRDGGLRVRLGAIEIVAGEDPAADAGSVGLSNLSCTGAAARRRVAFESSYDRQRPAGRNAPRPRHLVEVSR